MTRGSMVLGRVDLTQKQDQFDTHVPPLLP